MMIFGIIQNIHHTRTSGCSRAAAADSRQSRVESHNSSSSTAYRAAHAERDYCNFPYNMWLATNFELSR